MDSILTAMLDNFQRNHFLSQQSKRPAIMSLERLTRRVAFRITLTIRSQVQQHGRCLCRNAGIYPLGPVRLASFPPSQGQWVLNPSIYCKIRCRGFPAVPILE